MANLAVTPDSTIRLLKCPIRLDDHNQLTFISLQYQTNYFTALPYLTDSNMSYIRKDGVLRISTTASGQNQLTYEDVIKYNYCMYKNTHYEDKWFYAYVTDVKYINDGCCELTLETDVYQTWMFDLTLKDSFIEREHVNDDTLGKHTIPENVEMGEYVCNDYDYTSELDPTSYVLLATTKSDNTKPYPYFTPIGEIPFNGYIYVFNDPSDLSQVISGFMQYQENIYAVYSVPTFTVENAISASAPDTPFRKEAIPANNTLKEVNKPSSINGYTPKNNKVRCFPYTYLLLSNNNGQSTIFHYERFTQTKCTFNLVGLATMGGDIKIIPLNYDGMNHMEENSLIAGKWPTLSWSKDLYTSWVSQNGANIALGAGAGALSIVGGAAAIATGAGAALGAGMIAGGINSIANSMLQVYQHQMDPTAFRGNVNAGSINVENERNGFYFYSMSIKAEYAKIIDDYFSMFGYKVNRIGTPHIHTRTYYDYCKTIDVHIAGDIPENDMIKLRNLFNNGCTFWHLSNNFMNYNVNNSIL